MMKQFTYDLLNFHPKFKRDIEIEGTLAQQNDGINFNSNNVWFSKIVEKISNNTFNPIVKIAQVSVYYWSQVRRLSSSFNKHYTPFTEQSLGLQGDPTSPSYRKSVLNVHWKDWCWSWNYNTLATWSEELTHWKRPWCWESLKVGEGDNRGWDGWMASPTQWTWVWVNSGSWWWTGRPGVLQSMG